MDERVKFIAAVLDGTVSMSSLCLAYGISRKTGYKWLERYRTSGPEGLRERPHVAHYLPHRVSLEMERVLIRARKDHPSWGPHKISAWLKERDPKLLLPADSTIGEIFKRRGLVKPRPKRPKLAVRQPPIIEANRANAVWATDFKGDFKMLDGKRCNPLTISDLHSRYLIRCEALTHKTYEQTRRGFEQAFREYGLPEMILSDNGSPFSSVSGLSQLSLWWIRLGIRPIRIQPGKPQQNGIHERMHRTLGESINPPGINLADQQRAFRHFQKEFNFERPHEAIGQKTPASIYRASNRPYPNRLPQIEYPPHYELRKVSSSGAIKLRDQVYFLSHVLKEEIVGLETIDDGIWLVHFGPLALGHLIWGKKKLEGNTRLL